MLTLSHVTKQYTVGNSTVEAIRDIGFTVADGEFICIVGPSGAGKTTLLRCMCGLLRCTSGSIRLNGTEVCGPPRQLACVFQEYSRSLMPWLTVEHNVGLPLKNKVPSRAERGRRVRSALAQVGLDGFGKRYPWQLSGGMQQRVAIARALAYEPEILLLDEPFASVDAQTRADLEDLVLRVHVTSGITMVLVTHDIDEAVYLADRVVALSARPSTVLETIDVPLPRPRDQIATKADPRFAELRTQVLGLIRRPDTAPGADADLHPVGGAK
ncbi:ABC transporter ATP-binding protein [Dactylosporangium sp. CA-233914]|uniref:ABC transporter ATP-binding protein n=1 Tax=Dactylosporangium sp. CA-233914 TaxID=3239934 RepID=UPI003D8BFBC4